MVDDHRSHESVRRKALWTLSHLIPDDPKVAAIVDVLDNIEGQERVDLNHSHPGLYIDAVRRAVLIEPQLRNQHCARGQYPTAVA